MKFTRRGGVDVRIAFTAGSGTQGRLRVEVKDTGIGIPPSAHGRLFQEFSQVDATITRRFGGTGLGLAICKKIVTALGGTVGVESLEGVGSTSAFELPVEVAGDLRTVSAAIVTEQNTARLRVLLVEDNIVNQEVALLLLRKLGQEVTVVSDGEQAVELCRTSRFDLILMDMQMPVMDGLEATRLLRAAPGWSRDAPIVGLTANAFESDRTACLDAGMDDVVSKPVDMGKLRRALAAVTPAEDAARDAAPEVSRQQIDLVSEIGQKTFDRLLRAFAAEARGSLAGLEAALLAGDTERGGRITHAITGAAANLGCTRLVALLAGALPYGAAADEVATYVARCRDVLARAAAAAQSRDGSASAPAIAA